MDGAYRGARVGLKVGQIGREKAVGHLFEEVDGAVVGFLVAFVDGIHVAEKQQVIDGADLDVFHDESGAVGAGLCEDGGHVVAVGEVGLDLGDGGVNSRSNDGVVIVGYLVNLVVVQMGLDFILGDKHS